MFSHDDAYTAASARWYAATMSAKGRWPFHTAHAPCGSYAWRRSRSARTDAGSSPRPASSSATGSPSARSVRIASSTVAWCL